MTKKIKPSFKLKDILSKDEYARLQKAVDIVVEYMKDEQHDAKVECEPCSNCKETIQECACIRNKCHKCGKPVGNITFTVCDNCWDDEPKEQKQDEVEELAMLFNKHMDVHRDCNDGLGLANIAIEAGYSKSPSNLRRLDEKELFGYLFGWALNNNIDDELIGDLSHKIYQTFASPKPVLPSVEEIAKTIYENDMGNMKWDNAGALSKMGCRRIAKKVYQHISKINERA